MERIVFRQDGFTLLGDDRNLAGLKADDAARVVSRRSREQGRVHLPALVPRADSLRSDHTASVTKTDQRAEGRAAEGPLQRVEDRLLDNHLGDLDQEVGRELKERVPQRRHGVFPIGDSFRKLVEGRRQAVHEEVRDPVPLQVVVRRLLPELLGFQLGRFQLGDSRVRLGAADSRPHLLGVRDRRRKLGVDLGDLLTKLFLLCRVSGLLGELKLLGQGRPLGQKVVDRPLGFFRPLFGGGQVLLLLLKIEEPPGLFSDGVKLGLRDVRVFSPSLPDGLFDGRLTLLPLQDKLLLGKLELAVREPILCGLTLLSRNLGLTLSLTLPLFIKANLLGRLSLDTCGAAEQSGFVVNGVSISFVGICPDCREKS